MSYPLGSGVGPYAIPRDIDFWPDFLKNRRQWGLKVCHIFINKSFIYFFYSIQENFKTYEQDWMDKQINRMEATQEKNMKKTLF